MSTLAGKVAVVTGAARDRSIGGGIARVLARHGADVVVNDLAVTDEGERRVQEIRALGRRAALLAADVTDPASAEALMAQTVERMGRLDVVVANAGVCDWQTVADMSAGLWDRIVGVNLHGCFNTCRAAAAQMRAGGEGGRIIVDVVRARADAVRADERLRRDEAGDRAPRGRDGARMGA